MTDICDFRPNDFLACLFVGIREKLAKKAALPLFICCESANIYKSETETDIVIYRMADKKPDNFDTIEFFEGLKIENSKKSIVQRLFAKRIS